MNDELEDLVVEAINQVISVKGLYPGADEISQIKEAFYVLIASEMGNEIVDAWHTAGIDFIDNSQLEDAIHEVWRYTFD